MHCEALAKVLNIARKNPKILLSPAFFEKIAARLDIETKTESGKMVFHYGGRRAEAVIITAGNCQQFKCFVQEGKSGVRIFDFINVLVTLLAGEEIPPSPHEKMGPTAEFYCERGIDVLQKKFLEC